MILDSRGLTATRGDSGYCPSCGGALTAKCGKIVTWHWAHEVLDCDPWAEPESEWHLGWKRYFLTQGAHVEVVRPPHRADVVTGRGVVVELQSSYLNVDEIVDREAFYGPQMQWIYRAHWMDRLHFGRRGFWWKHGSQAMCRHRRPVWWDMGAELWKVQISVVEVDRFCFGEDLDGVKIYDTGTKRVLGRVLARRPSPLATSS